MWGYPVLLFHEEDSELGLHVFVLGAWVCFFGQLRGGRGVIKPRPVESFGPTIDSVSSTHKQTLS